MAKEERHRGYAAKVNTLCKRYLGNEEDAKGLMLETLIRAIDKIEFYQYTREGCRYSWISRIAINKAINHIKRHR